MKKSIYFPGIASTTLMLFGCMFKIMHWPGANIMLILSVFLFCFYFLPVALIANYKSQEAPKHKTLHVVTFMTFFVCMMGVIFKVLHWPGAGVLLIIGLPLPFVLFLPVYIYSTRHERKENNINFLGLMFGMIFLAVFSVLLALSISKQVLRNGITRDYSIERSTEFTEVAIGKTSSDNVIKKEADDLYVFIQDIKMQLLKMSENENVINKPENMWQMNGVDGKSATSTILFAEGEKNKFNELQQRVRNFREKLLATRKANTQLNNLVNALFNTDVVKEMFPNGSIEELNWEQREFANKQLIFVLGALSQIQNNVRVVELEYLASVK